MQSQGEISQGKSILAARIANEKKDVVVLMGGRCVSFTLLDRLIVVESESAGFISDLQRCFEDVVAHSPAGSASADLYVSVTAAKGAESIYEVKSAPEQVLQLQAVRVQGAGWTVGRALVQWAIDSASHHYVFHSGSIAHDGHGVLLPGSSHSGKSTLTVALAQRGFDILSDEVGAIRADTGLQTAFGRSLSIRSSVVRDLGLASQLDAKCLVEDAYILQTSSLGLSRTSTARLSLVVFPTYSEHAATDLQAIRPAAAAMALYEASCSQARWKVAGLDFVIDLAKSIPCFELTYSNMHDAAREIANTLAAVCASKSEASPLRNRATEKTASSQ